MLGTDAAPVAPVERYLAYLTDIERSPNTVKAYAHDMKDWFSFLDSSSWPQDLRLPGRTLLHLKVTARPNDPDHGGRGWPASTTGGTVTRHHHQLAEGGRPRGLSRKGRSLAALDGVNFFLTDVQSGLEPGPAVTGSR